MRHNCVLKQASRRRVLATKHIQNGAAISKIDVRSLGQSDKLPPFSGIQALLGVAAVMVTVHHLTLFWSAEFLGSQTANQWTHGAAGVDIFFLISGFVMAISTTGERVPTALDFMRRRVIRIAPLYWLATLAMCLKPIILAFYPSLAVHNNAPTSVRYILACLFFIPARDATGSVIPILNAGWTLNLEMFFYLLFATALLLGIRPIRFLTPAMLILAAIGLSLPENRPAIAVLTDPIMLEFLAGVLLAYAVRGGFRINVKLAALLGLGGIAALLITSPQHTALYREMEWGIPALLILVAVVMLEQRYGRLWPQWILKIGDASYSLYLIHVLLRWPLISLAHKVPAASAHQGVFVTGALAILLLIARLSYWIIEKRFTRVLSRLNSTKLPVNIVLETEAA